MLVKMEVVGDRNEMFSCSATFADILIIGEQLRVCMHTEKNNLVRDQRYLLRWHSCCFVGSEVVGWLVKAQKAPERFIAVALMNILLEHHIIHHVTGSGVFKDDSNLYRFRKDDGTYDYIEDTSVFLRGHRLCKRIMSDPQGRKIILTRTQNQQVFTHCAAGCELVDWMVQRHEAPSRDEAVKELRTMLESNLIRHVTDSQHFRDDSALYQFRTDFGRDRLLLDLILPPPQPEFGGPIIEGVATDLHKSSSFIENNNGNKIKNSSTDCLNNGSKTPTHNTNMDSNRRVNSVSKDMILMEAKGICMGTERTESGYHSDHVDGSPSSSLSESPMFDLEVGSKPSEKTSAPFSGGVLIRKASKEELENPDSPYIKKFIRIVSDPVGYGFVIRGDGPVYVKTLDPMGPAAAAGLKVGHYIYSVNDQEVLEVNHRDLAHVILDSNGYVTLVVMEHVRDSR